MMHDIDLINHFSFAKNNEIIVDEYINKILIDTINNKKRVEHSKSVAQLAYEIALSNSLEKPFDYYIAGLFHDLAKGLSTDELTQYMLKYYPDYLDLPIFSYHQFVGVVLAKQLLNIQNKWILDSIECHCTGKSNMTSIDMIIYAADKTDPLRGYDSSSMIEMIKSNYYDGFINILNENRIFLLSKKGNSEAAIDNRLSKSCFDFYLEKVV